MIGVSVPCSCGRHFEVRPVRGLPAPGAQLWPRNALQPRLQCAGWVIPIVGAGWSLDDTFSCHEGGRVRVDAVTVRMSRRPHCMSS